MDALATYVLGSSPLSRAIVGIRSAEFALNVTKQAVLTLVSSTKSQFQTQTPTQLPIPAPAPLVVSTPNPPKLTNKTKNKKQHPCAAPTAAEAAQKAAAKRVKKQRQHQRKKKKREALLAAGGGTTGGGEQLPLPAYEVYGYSGTAANRVPLVFNRMVGDVKVETGEKGEGDRERAGGVFVKREISPVKQERGMVEGDGPGEAAWMARPYPAGYSQYVSAMRDSGLTFYHESQMAAVSVPEFPNVAQHFGLAYSGQPSGSRPAFTTDMAQPFSSTHAGQFSSLYKPQYIGSPFIPGGTEWEQAGFVHVDSALDDHDIHSVADTNQSVAGDEDIGIEDGEIFEDPTATTIPHNFPPFPTHAPSRPALTTLPIPNSKIIATQPKRKAGAGYKDGDVVGEAAPKMDAGSKGRAMMLKMGWNVAVGLGAEHNRGMMSPLKQIFKGGKEGLR